MLPRNSFTFSSDPVKWRDLRVTSAWFVAFLVLFELGTWLLFTATPLSRSSLKTYFWYGTSYEWKLRELVNSPSLPEHSVLAAGWLGDAAFAVGQPDDVDVTVYGMSFSAQLGDAALELRPQLKQRSIGGPGAPMSAVYGYYQADRSMRKTRYALVGATSGAVGEVRLMNRGSLYSDSAFPYFFPRYEVDGTGVRRVADPVINSAEELRTALNASDRSVWEQQLAVLAAHDSSYHRFFFAHDLLDYSALGRLVRRGMAKRQSAQFNSEVFGPDGYNMQNEAPPLFRALLRQKLRDLNAEQVQPIVALFALHGSGNHLYELVADVLAEEKALVLNTNDFCPSDNRDNYLRDMHFNHECNLKFARGLFGFMDALDALDARASASAPASP